MEILNIIDTLISLGGLIVAIVALFKVDSVVKTVNQSIKNNNRVTSTVSQANKNDTSENSTNNQNIENNKLKDSEITQANHCYKEK